MGITLINENASSATTAASPAASLRASAAASSTANGLTPGSNTIQPKRVLTVGDGNFSYSLAYAKRFLVTQAAAAPSQPSSTTTVTAACRNDAIQLVATSYDSYDELVDKYPESARIVAQLRDSNALVLHRIDATNLRASLAIAGKAASSEPSTSTRESELPSADAVASTEERDLASTTATDPFDVIIFNHPHCGEENVRRHQSLLSHFYISALELLRSDGEIHLTLAAGQPERWQALERAQRAGLRLKQQIDDVDSDDAFGLAYERKRHQNGKSFHRVLLHGEKLEQQSTLFIFARAGAGTVPQLVSSDTDTNSAAVGTSDGIISTDTPTRKRKAQDASEPLSQRKQQQQQQPAAFACDACDRSFKTAQGFKTHVHMVHELAQNSASAKATPVLLPCGVCDRTFKNADAQRQHRLAKHGADQLIQPDWYQKQQAQSATSVAPDTATPAAAPTNAVGSTDAQEQQSLTCSICHLAFRSQSAFDNHWQDLRPKEVVWRNCSRCSRAFDEERALRQHQNFCKASGKIDGDASH